MNIPGPPQNKVVNNGHSKLPRLPHNASVSKRPLFRPAIASPHAGAQQQKIVYISTRTAFLGAVKRVERLLHLSDKRLVQSTTATARKASGNRKRKSPAENKDTILEIASEVERQKAQKRRKTSRDEDEDADAGEEVVIKGTGKAITKVLEMALWFQQRDDQYQVRMSTGTATAIDDIELEDVKENTGVEFKGAEDAAETLTENPPSLSPVPEIRIRFASVLEVAVSLR